MNDVYNDNSVHERKWYGEMSEEIYIACKSQPYKQNDGGLFPDTVNTSRP